jgi:glycerol uptake facilitator-like aquaporin
MDKKLLRVYLVELLGTFALVYFAAGVVLANQMTMVDFAGLKGTMDSPSQKGPGFNPLTGFQPGLMGIALAQGLILAALLAITVPVSGGYLNPAITIMLWVFNRLDSNKLAWFVGAQLLGAALAGYCLQNTFHIDILKDAHFATPHLNLVVYDNPYKGNLIAGTSVELVLTFFLVFAIFGLGRCSRTAGRASLAAGAVLTAGVLFAFPLTGAAANPARWFGTVIWEWMYADENRKVQNDAFMYIAGPVVGALAAGLFYFKVYQPAVDEMTETPLPAAEGHKAASTAIKPKK